MARISIVVTGRATGNSINSKELAEIIANMLKSLTGERVTVFNRSISKARSFSPKATTWKTRSYT